jgi:hypothetical protein
MRLELSTHPSMPVLGSRMKSLLSTFQHETFDSGFARRVRAVTIVTLCTCYGTLTVIATQ